MSKVERLVNLTVALLDARRPRTFAELRASTGYWQQDDAESARRMFERDKDELRRLGVPIETVSLDAFDTETGYVIDRDRYEMPTVDLDRDEVAALAIALRVTNRSQERLALGKLAAMAPDPGAATTPETDLAVHVADEPPEELTRAVFERRRLRFAYSGAGGEASRRDLEPYGIVRRRGRSYVVGRDRDREALRAFRVDRIVGQPEVVGDRDAFEVPADADLVAQVRGPVSGAVDLELRVSPAAAWAVEARGGTREGAADAPSGWTRHVVRGVDRGRCVSWLLALVPDVVVDGPAEVRDEVVAALRRLADVTAS